jgi:predicted DNA binding CopG/RHH family protein
MGGVAKAVGGVVKGAVDLVGDVVESVGKAVVDVVDFVVDDIIDPIVGAVGDVIAAIEEDPLMAIAQVALVATGNAWALPLLAGADVAMAGGDLGDVLKAAAISYVAGEVGSYAGKAVGNYVSSAAGAAQYGVTAGSQQATMLALQEAGMQTASQIAGRIVGSGAGASAAAVVMGRDPVQAFITGGVSAAVPAALGQVPGFTKLPPSAQQVIAQAVRTQLSGGNITAAIIGSAIQASGVVTDILNQFDPDGTKMTDAQRAIATDILMGTATAALTGGDVNAAIRASLMKSGSKALGDMVSTGFKDAVKGVSDKNAEAEKVADKMDANVEQQKKVAANYNKTVEELNGRVAEQDRLKAAYDKAVAAQKANPTQATTDAANAAAKRYNDYATKLNDDYAKTYQPQIDTYAKELAKIQTDYGNLETVFNDAMKGVVDATDAVKKELKPAIDASNKAFVEVMDPNFNAEEYREINKLGADVDVYEHWLSQGQYEGLKTNDKDVVVRDSIDKYVAATGEEPPKHILESFTRGDNDNRDKDMQQYVDTTIRDREKQAEFRSQVTNSVLDAYKAEGLSDEQINAKIDSGEANQYVDAAIQRKRESVGAMQEYTRAVGEKFGAESSEYKAAYKDTLNAMADVGGYGVTKDEDKFNLAGAGTLDPDTLKPDTLKPDTGGSRGWYDPVTGVWTIQIWLWSAKDKDYSSLLAIGDSAKPPTQGGESVFGDGSGVSAGLFGGLMPIAFDDGRGDQSTKMFGGNNGFALIAYSDGTGAAVNTNTNEVIWVSPEQMEGLLGDLPPAKAPVPAKGNAEAPTPTAPVSVDPVADAVTTIKNNIQSPQEVVEALKAAGYTATLEEAKQFAGEKTPEQLREEVNAYANPRVVTAEEAKAAYEALGLKKPTQDDIAKLVGQYDEAELAGKAETYLPTARYNSVMKQLDELAATSGQDQEILDAIELVKADIAEQVKGLGYKIDEQTGVLTDAITATEKNILDKVAEYEKTGLTRDEAIQKAVDDVAAELGTTREDLLKRIDTTEENLIKSVDVLSKDVGALSTKIGDVEANLIEKIAANEEAGMTRDEALGKAIDDVAAELGTTREDILTRIGQTESALTGQITDLSTDVQVKYDALTAEQKALADQLTRQGIDLNTAIDTAKTELTGEITTVRDTLGRAGATASQADLDAIINILENQGAYDANYDYNGDGVIDQRDADALSGIIGSGGGGGGAAVSPGTGVGTGTGADGVGSAAAGSKWAPTGVFKTVADEAERTRQANAAAALRTQQANAAAALRTQRMGNINTMMGMLGQAPDVGGQQVTAKTPDPAKIGYIYDFNSIFANPAQEKMFASPYGAFAQGGVVRNDTDDINDELLKMLKG